MGHNPANANGLKIGTDSRKKTYPVVKNIFKKNVLVSY